MNKKDSGAKKAMTYVLLLGLIACALVYFLIYRKYNDKADKLKASNVELNDRVKALEVVYNKSADYEKSIADMQDEIRRMLDEYPADVEEENMTMLAVESMKTAVVDYKNMNITDKNVLLTIPADTVQAGGMEEFQNALSFVQQNACYVNTCDYFNLKDIVKTINGQADRNVIDTITYTKNKELNNLEGTIEVRFCSVAGTNKEYVPVNIKDYEAGTEDLFNLMNAEEWAEKQKQEEENAKKTN